MASGQQVSAGNPAMAKDEPGETMCTTWEDVCHKVLDQEACKKRTTQGTVVEVAQRLMSHQTQWSYWGWVLMGQMTQPTVLKH